MVAAISILQQSTSIKFVPTRAIMQQELCSKMTAPFYKYKIIAERSNWIPEGRKKVISSLLNLKERLAPLFLSNTATKLPSEHVFHAPVKTYFHSQ